MSAAKNTSNHGGAPQEEKATERISPEEFRRKIKIAQERGESVTELVREFVLSTIDEVMEELEDENGTEGE